MTSHVSPCLVAGHMQRGDRAQRAQRWVEAVEAHEAALRTAEGAQLPAEVRHGIVAEIVLCEEPTSLDFQLERRDDPPRGADVPAPATPGARGSDAGDPPSRARSPRSPATPAGPQKSRPRALDGTRGGVGVTPVLALGLSPSVSAGAAVDAALRWPGLSLGAEIRALSSQTVCIGQCIPLPPLNLSYYQDDACTAILGSAVLSAELGPGCNDVQMAGAELGSMEAAWIVNEPGSCAASGGEPVGEIHPVDPRTFCCQPLQ